MKSLDLDLVWNPIEKSPPLTKQEAETLAYLEARWRVNQPQWFQSSATSETPSITHGQCKPTNLPSTETTSQRYEYCHDRESQGYRSNIAASRIQKSSVATRTHKRHERPSEQLREFSLQNGKQKKNAIRGSASKASSITKPLFVHQNHPRNAWDLSKKRARLNARDIQYTSLSRSFGIAPHEKSGYGTLPSYNRLV